MKTVKINYAHVEDYFDKEQNLIYDILKNHGYDVQISDEPDYIICDALGAEYYEYCKKYVDPRNIPPSVIEDAISSTKGIPGNRPDTFIHETADVKIVINSAGKVITVIPK